MSWTSLIEPLITTKADLEALIFSRGVHLKAKELALQSESKTEPTAFLAYDTNETAENMQEVLQHLASLTARFSGKGGSGGGDRLGRGGGKGGETRSCYECGKKGHLRPNCPELPKNKNKNKNKAKDPDEHARPAAAFVASTSALMSAASSSSSSSEATWVIDSGASLSEKVSLLPPTLLNSRPK
jgi:hypothetical protein